MNKNIMPLNFENSTSIQVLLGNVAEKKMLIYMKDLVE